jgi:quinol monooxygenase YgiN
MSIARIGEFQANAGAEEELRAFMLSIMPLITGSAGCESCQLYQSQEDASTFIMVEIWDSIESHQDSVKNIPPEMIAEIRPLLAGSPSGRYFDLIAHT